MNFNALVDFLIENWKLISILVLLVVDFILLLFRRNKTQIYDSSAYSHLLTLVNEAEEKFGSGHGEEKLQYVLDGYFALTGIKDDSWNRSSVRILIERILSAPQKKKGD